MNPKVMKNPRNATNLTIVKNQERREKTENCEKDGNREKSWNFENPKIVKGSGRFCKVLEGSGRFWKVLRGSGRFWKVLERSGRLWKALEGPGRFWKVLEGYGRFWKVLKGFSVKSCRIARRCLCCRTVRLRASGTPCASAFSRFCVLARERGFPVNWVVYR